MKNFLIAVAVVIFCVACPSQAHAQGVLSNVSFTGSFSGFFGSTSQPAVITAMDYQVTQRWSGGYWNLQIPSKSVSGNFGVVDYTLPLSSLLPKRFVAALMFDASAIPVSFDGGGGDVKDALGNNHVGGLACAGFGIPMTPVLTFTPAKVCGVFAGGGNSGAFYTPTSFAALTSLNVHLDTLGAGFKHRFTNKKKAAVKLGRCQECQ